MRCLLKVNIPVETGNEAARNGTLGTTIDSILKDLNPEAAYFTATNGERGGYVVFDLKSTSDIPAIAEPWFLALNARVEIQPAMNVEDLRKAAPGIERAVKNYRVLKQAA